MPPGNSNNKAAVRNKCTFCGKSTCVGNECYMTRYPPRNYEPVRPNVISQPSFISTTTPVSLNTRSESDIDTRGQSHCTFCGKETCVSSSCRNVGTAGSVNKTDRPPVPASKSVSANQDALTTITPINVLDTGSSSGVRNSDGSRNASSEVTTVSNTNSSLDKSSSSTVSVTPIARTTIIKQNTVPVTASSTEGINALAEVPLEVKPKVTIKSVVAISSTSPVSEASTSKDSKDEQNVSPETLSSAGKSHAAEESSSVRVANNVEGRNSLLDNIKSPVSSFITPQENSETVSLQTKLNLPDNIIFNKVPVKIKGSSVLQGEYLLTGKFDEKTVSIHSRPIEKIIKGAAQQAVLYSNVDKKTKGSRSGSKIVNKNGSICSEDGSESLSSVNDQKPRKHSKGAVMYEGIVVKHLSPRVATIKVTSPGAKNKTVQLFVDRLLLPKSESFYSVNTDIKSILCIGDILKLVCTVHNKKTAFFDLFAHEAWKVENLNSNKFDSESVASFVSRDSLSGSEIQERKSSKSRFRRIKDVPQSEQHNLSDTIYQWLDQNKCIQTNNNFPKKIILTEDCSYIGNVTELRLPFSFIAEIFINDAVEYVFGIARNFYPEGPDSHSLEYGVKIDCYLHVGSTVILTVTRSETPREGKYEWMVKKAWPFGQGNKTFQFLGSKKKCLEASASSVSKCVPVAQIEPQKTTNFLLVTPRIDSDVYGEIVTLQSNWGLVKEIGGLSTYVFLRKNAFLFGVCLQNYVLDDVLDEGQLVWFNKDNDENKIYANKVWHGDKLSNFYSFEKVMRSYCEEMQISYNNEDSLVNLGKEVYLEK